MSNNTSRLLIRLSHWLPVFNGVALLVYALIPHLWFVYEGEAYTTLSLFQLAENTWLECRTIRQNAVKYSGAQRLFAQEMTTVTVLFWVFLVLYFILAIATAAGASYAFSKKPTDRLSKRAKRIVSLFCPNRVCYVLFQLLPLFCGAFPYFLVGFRSKTEEIFTVHYEIISDLLLAGILIGCSILLYLILLPQQKKQQMDLFTVYPSSQKSK